MFPQVAAPMYHDYNIAKAKEKYGDDPDAVEKLVSDNETEVAIPIALGSIATGLEFIGLKGVTRHIASKPGTAARFTKLLWVGSGEGATDVGQLGLETFNQSLGEGKTVEESSALAFDDMASDKGLEMFFSGFIGSTTVGS